MQLPPPGSKSHYQNNGVIEIDYNRGDTSIGLKVTHEKLAVLSYFQSVTPKFAAGVESVYHPTQSLLLNRYVAQYDNREDVTTVSMGDNGAFHANYARRVNDRLTLASELRFDANSRESQFKVGYKWSLRQAQFKGTISSDGVVAATLEELISPALKLSLSGQISHFTNQYRFGIGATVG